MAARSVAALCMGVGLVLAVPQPACSQDFEFPIEEREWMLRNLRPTGQPVIPVFEGWMTRPDSTHDLCFGYFNMNLEEAIDIPLGPDDYIEPPEFDGAQPTHFMEVPEREGR